MRLPDFIVIGAMKCGTTSLLHNLRLHPEIGMPSKEVHFFDKNWQRGLDWYRERFAGFQQRLVGEKTPDYVASDYCLQRIKQVTPNAKLLLLLRNPVNRWVSNWKMGIHRGWVTVPEELFDRQLQRERRTGVIPTILWRGCYEQQMRTLLSMFPRQQLHVGLMERMAKDPAAYYTEVCEFLGISYLPELGTIVSNVSPVSDSVSLSLRVKLRLYYEDHNRRLSEFLDDGLEEWREFSFL